VKRPSTHTLRSFMLMEVVSGIALLSLTLTGVYAGIHLNEKMLRHGSEQQLAVDVLDNVVERLAAMPPASLAQCRTAFEDELKRSSLTSRKQLESRCTQAVDGRLHCLIRRRGHLLAEVRIGTP